MSKIIEIEELGFPKSLIIRDGALVSELIDTKDLVNELNEQLRLYNAVGRNEQLKCEKCGAKFVPHLMKPLTICDKCADSFAL